MNAVQDDASRSAAGGRADRLRLRWGNATGGEQLRRLAWGLVAILVALYLVSWLAHLHDTIDALLWNSDYASGFTLPETIARYGAGGNTVISTTGAWADLWFGLVTVHLPLHRQLWEITPTVLSAACSAMVAWGTGRVGGRGAAAAAAAIVFVASPFSLAILMAPVAHNTVYPSAALIGLLIPSVLTRRWSSRRGAAAAIVVAAMLLGIDTASDKLVLIASVVPAGIVALAALLRPRSRAAALGVVLAIVLSVPVTVAVNAIMKAAGYRITAPRISIAPLSQVGFHFRLLWHGLRDLSGGYLDHGYPGTLHRELGIACTVVLALGLLLLARAGVLAAIRLCRRDSSESVLPGWVFHVAYWFVSAVLVAATFVFTTVVGSGVGNHESYFLTIVFSVAAAAPFGVARILAFRWAAPVAAGVFAVGSIVGSQGKYNDAYRGPLASVAGQIVALARADHATNGFSGYWDASNLTWQERGAITVRPLETCGNPNPKGSDICPFFLMRTPAWYRVQPGRSFLLVDPNNLYVTKLPDNLGTPLHVYNLGPVTMYVYSYDIASRLGPYPSIAPA